MLCKLHIPQWYDPVRKTTSCKCGKVKIRNSERNNLLELWRVRAANESEGLPTLPEVRV